MTAAEVQNAYTKRSDEYTSLLGSMAATHELDQQLVSRWAAGLSGPVVDAGCGPGHWTDFLNRQGSIVEGIDIVPGFIASAKRRFPNAPFRVARLDDLGTPDRYAAGILAWYPPIHTEPRRVPLILREFARCIAPGGRLLLGFFEGANVEPFPHAVTTAYFWPVADISKHLMDSGFKVEEVHTRTDPGKRPHAAIIARRMAPQTSQGESR